MACASCVLGLFISDAHDVDPRGGRTVRLPHRTRPRLMPPIQAGESWIPETEPILQESGGLTEVAGTRVQPYLWDCPSATACPAQQQPLLLIQEQEEHAPVEPGPRYVDVVHDHTARSCVQIVSRRVRVQSRNDPTG